MHFAEQALVRPGVAERAATGEWFPALDVELHLVSRHDHYLRMRRSNATPTAYIEALMLYTATRSTPVMRECKAPI